MSSSMKKHKKNNQLRLTETKQSEDTRFRKASRSEASKILGPSESEALGDKSPIVQNMSVRRDTSQKMIKEK